MSARPDLFHPIGPQVRRTAVPLLQLAPPTARASSATDGSPRRSRTPLWALSAFAVVAGLGIGRFVTAGEGEVAPAAIAFSSVGTPDERIAALQSTVAADPDDATAWRLLGTAYAQRGAETQDPAMLDAAAEAFDRAAALTPDDAAIVVGRGLLALTNHQFARAEQLGTEAVDRLPANADALAVLVDAQVELGRYDDAAETLQRMLDARPGLPALARTSYLRELAGDLDGAREAMRRAAVAGAASTYDVASVTALLGDLHRKGGDLDAASEAYRQALDAAPELITAQAGAAWARAARGDVDGAIADLRRLADRMPAPSLLLLLHDLQAGSGSPAADDTAELIRAVASLQEASGQVVDLEMAIFEADVAEDADRAVELARRAQAARPDNVFVDDAVAWALFRAGDTDAALGFAEEALRLGTTEPLLRYHAAEIFSAAGRVEEAAEHLRIALRDPWFSFQHHDRALDLASELGISVAEPA
jgi:tetratricopeptide (TPR) repeat protein